MKRAISGLCLLLSTVACLAKDNPRITIQVVDAQSSTRHITYTIPGTNEHSTTNCNGNATATDTGSGTVVANGATNCTTTATPATPPSTGAINIAQPHVHAIMPNGTHLTLWCQAGWRHCSTPNSGNYTAEVEGNTVWLHVYDLGGKEHRIKYHYIGGW